MLKEEKLDISLNDSKIVSGYFVEPKEKKVDSIIIFVHGFLGKANEHIFFNGSRYFAEKGFATYRFDFYNLKENCRNLNDSLVDTHVCDLNQVIGFFEEKYKKIIIIAHSLGGMIVLNTEKASKHKIILWDPAINVQKHIKVWIKRESQENLLLNLGYNIFLSRKYVDSIKKLDVATLNEFANFKSKLTFIFAGRYILKSEWINIIKNSTVKHNIFTISEANHTFDSHSWEDQLFKLTLLSID